MRSAIVLLALLQLFWATAGLYAQPATHATCLGQAPPQSKLQLVFSDEFNKAGRNFGSGQDSRWLAMDMYYAATNDKEVYKPDQVTTKAGTAVLTLEKAPAPVSARTQDPWGAITPVAQPYISGMLQGWNKFCFTGGYVEASIKLPGDAYKTGFWPAFWMMGNLGRAGLLNTTGGLWPYSYDKCEGSGPSGFDKLPGQLINACPDPAGFNRTAAWGFNQGQGRGSPEIDIMELMVNAASVSSVPAPTSAPTIQPAAGLRSQPAAPSASRASIGQTVQMGPIMPSGTHWVDPAFYAAQGVQDGAIFPGASTNLKTRLNPQWGPYSTPGQLPRPSGPYQDSMSAVSDIGQSFFGDFHKFGLDWAPGEYLRWYIDGVFTFELNKEALAARENALGQKVGQRQIPEEPMYLLFNLAMSDLWVVQDPKLDIPATLEVDYVRVYQDPANLRLGCSPPDFPTAQYIACNQKQYILNPEDASLITEKCLAAPAAAAAKQVATAGRKLLLQKDMY
ncbi:hypothetical protein WJX72_004030 [[Myrmecia] bisecta]|uniref:GH16 domain-containing protein n=1 Tax=[Myrmecia] bisecta TaxID=41462 RepID=A0AAW1PWZ7_9CHLO